MNTRCFYSQTVFDHFILVRLKQHLSSGTLETCQEDQDDQEDQDQDQYQDEEKRTGVVVSSSKMFLCTD